jgi:tetratricopeptide (TPR) repeat protein
MARRLRILLTVIAAISVQPGMAASGQPLLAPLQGAKLSPVEMFTLADTAQKRGNLATAEAVYRALAGDSQPEIRAEARFRHGMMLAAVGRLSEAALLFRKILDDRPRAQRVRLELARTLDLLGDEAGARRALREAQAGRLPSDVARFVQRYSEALRAQKPLGGSIEVAIAPDSNINRATRSDTLGTVLGDFTLDQDAKQRSGVGLALGAQGYARLPLAPRASLLARVSGSADLYKHGAFNDISVGLSAGPELQLGQARGSAELGISRRWFGGDAYSTVGTASLSYLRPLDRRSLLRVTAAIGLVDNHSNPLQDGGSYALTAAYERAFSSRSGVGASIAAQRQSLRDPGYSISAGQITVFGYRELGPMTLIGSLGYGRLAADERLLLYPDVRKDTLYRGSLGMTFRQLTVGQFAPSIRVTAERNRSSIETFDYRRTRTEFMITRAF